MGSKRAYFLQTSSRLRSNRWNRILTGSSSVPRCRNASGCSFCRRRIRGSVSTNSASVIGRPSSSFDFDSSDGSAEPRTFGMASSRAVSYTKYETEAGDDDKAIVECCRCRSCGCYEPFASWFVVAFFSILFFCFIELREC